MKASLDSEQALKEALIERYSKIERINRTHRLKFYAKRLLWLSVIRSTYIAKRVFDIFCSLTCLVLLAPLLMVFIVLIKMDSPGPVFFSQIRVGRWGETFRMWKFRSMYIDAEARKAALMAENEMQGGVIFKMQRDPRITRIGRFIRKASIDELPQLWNVLIGDMSIVGPRPPLPVEVKDYTLFDRQRLNIIPGITCIWQVSGRSDIPFHDQVRLDVKYIESQSFWTDIRILLQTIPAVLLGRGAY